MKLWTLAFGSYLLEFDRYRITTIPMRLILRLGKSERQADWNIMDGDRVPT